MGGSVRGRVRLESGVRRAEFFSPSGRWNAPKRGCALSPAAYYVLTGADRPAFRILRVFPNSLKELGKTGAAGQDRTVDLSLTKDALYH